MLRDKILELVRQHYEENPRNVSGIPVAGRVYDAEEVCNLVESALDFNLTTDIWNETFQKKLGIFLGARYPLTCNSGSSANLLAVSALTSPLLKDRALKAGDEVITCATGFPTTVNPIMMNGLVPVFVDVDIPTYNIDTSMLEAAVSSRTRAIVLAHTLGNPFNLRAVMRLAEKYNLFVIEDCCDALGATYQGQMVGTFGNIGTLSFYPAHHITMGEGGAVFTNRSLFKRILESLRDWGRDCYCEPGRDNTCGKRYDWQLGDLPAGYDHKYTYSHMGYNLKITDMQAAVGCAQMDKLAGFIQQRRANFQTLHDRLKEMEEHFILPEATPNSNPSWFGFPITLRGNRYSREDVLRRLGSYGVGTRLLFGGDLTKQPYMKGREYRVAGELTNSQIVMNDTFWVGVYPGLSEGTMNHIAAILKAMYA